MTMPLTPVTNLTPWSAEVRPTVTRPHRPGLSSFEEQALPHLEHVARFARWLTRDEATADDLVQETYLKALRAWDSFTSGTDCRSWLLTICRNQHLSSLRRERRVEAVDSPDLEALAAARVFQAAQAAGVDAAFGRFDVQDAVRRELQAVPDSYREVVALVDLEGLSYEEVARLLDLPVGTVRSRLFRGRRLLQERLLAHAEDARFTTRARRRAQ